MIRFFFLGPNPVSNIVPLVDSTNLTLEWPRPEGRVERYIITWAADGSPGPPRLRNLTEDNVVGEEGRLVRLLIGDLTPGVKYHLELHTTSYGLDSDAVRLTARTMPQIQSEVLIVNDQQVLPTFYNLEYFLSCQFTSVLNVPSRPRTPFFQMLQIERHGQLNLATRYEMRDEMMR